MSMEAEIEVGVLRADEMEPLLHLMCEAFEMDVDAARPIFTADPYLDIQNRYVLRVDGSIASCLTVVDRECWIGEAIVRVAGIAGVATRLEYRRRGLAGRLLKETLQSLSARGFHIAALFPANRSYYRNYGWETAGSQHTAHIVRASMGSDTDHKDLAQRHKGTRDRSMETGLFPESERDLAQRRKDAKDPRAETGMKSGLLQVRPAVPDDMKALARIYDNATRGRTMHCLRDEKRWQYLLTYVKECVVAVTNDDAVRGYALYAFQPDQNGSPSSPTAAANESTLRLLEIYCETSEAIRALQSHLGKQCAADHIKFTAPSDVLIQNRFPIPDTETASFMTRIIDWDGLLLALSTNWKAFDGKIGLALIDPALSPVPRCAVVQGTGSRAVVAPVNPTELSTHFPDFVVGDVRGWSSVVVGYRSARAAFDNGSLKASTASAAALTECLFPAREPFLPTADHF